ncbi:hypothetical protein BGZ94_008953 [Podila epigama]|nr:hypothetical protein BGZ94_008953 [Podila epigama]
MSLSTTPSTQITINSEKSSIISSTGRDSGHQGSFSNTSGIMSVLSVPLQDPFYIDLQALKADHAALSSQLKLAQQTVHHSHQDVAQAQERSKRAEADMARLKSRLEILLKKHVEHHPERQVLAQQVGELQTQLEKELSSRRVLEQEHVAIQQELLGIRLAQSTGTKSSSSQKQYQQHQQQYPQSPRRSMGTSSSSSSLFNFGMGGATQSPAVAPSPTASVRSNASSTFSSFFSSSSRRKDATGNKMSIKNMATYEKEEIILQEPEREEATNMPQDNMSMNHPHHSLTEAKESPSAPSSSPGNCSDCGHRRDSLDAMTSTSESLAPCLNQEQLDLEKQFYEKLKEENIAMKMELHDLRHRNIVERDSIKSYMSLFESLQKKQTNALAVAQTEIDLLKAAAVEHELWAESRETLIQKLIATVQDQAVELEKATADIGRERASRAKVEQEMATLLEASLLMLERWFSNVEQTKIQLIRVLDPVRQTVHLMEVPSIIEEWENCEKDLQNVMHALELTLVHQQELQEQELVRDSAFGGSSHSQDSVQQRHSRGANNASTSSGGSTQSKDSSKVMDYYYQRRGSNSSSNFDNNSLSHNSDDNQAAMLVLNNAVSRNVFTWRRSLADGFLEECVQTVETLAREKRELQTQTMELAQAIMELEGKLSIHKVKSIGDAELEQPVGVESNEQEDVHDDRELLQKQKVETGNKGDSGESCPDAPAQERIKDATPSPISEECDGQQIPDAENSVNEPGLEALEECTKDATPMPANEECTEGSTPDAEKGANELGPEALATSEQCDGQPIPHAESGANELGLKAVEEYTKDATSSPTSRECTEGSFPDAAIATDALLPLQTSEQPASSAKDSKRHRLEAIFSRLLSLSDRDMNVQKHEAVSKMDEDVLALGISSPPQERDTGYTTLLATSDEANTEDLDVLLQMIRDELPFAQRSKVGKESKALEAPFSSVFDKDNSYVLPNASISNRSDTKAFNSKQNTLAMTDSVIRLAVEKPTTLDTLHRAKSCLISRSSSSTTPSLTPSLSTSSSSCYFSTRIGGVSTPGSPGIGVGFDGQVLDMDALCRDLAFRSFPKQHQWSKSRASMQSSNSRTMPTEQHVNASQSLLISSTSLMSLPPLPPSSIASIPL